VSPFAVVHENQEEGVDEGAYAEEGKAGEKALLDGVDIAVPHCKGSAEFSIVGQNNSLIVGCDLAVVVCAGGWCDVDCGVRVVNRIGHQSLEGGGYLRVEQIELVLGVDISEKGGVVEGLIVEVVQILQEGPVYESIHIGFVWVENTLKIDRGCLVPCQYVLATFLKLSSCICKPHDVHYKQD
jgi:hypothetical protein